MSPARPTGPTRPAPMPRDATAPRFTLHEGSSGTYLPVKGSVH
jgi:hypothetical protein